MKTLDLNQHRNSVKILRQTPHSQLGIVTLAPSKDIWPDETSSGDHIIHIIEGKARVEIGKEKFLLTAGMIFFVPPNMRHHIFNIGLSNLFYVNIYCPPIY